MLRNIATIDDWMEVLTGFQIFRLISPVMHRYIAIPIDLIAKVHGIEQINGWRCEIVNTGHNHYEKLKKSDRRDLHAYYAITDKGRSLSYGSV